MGKANNMSVNIKIFCVGESYKEIFELITSKPGVA